MVMLPNTFNRADVPDDDFDPIPAGVYEAVINESEMKATKDELGAYLQLKIVIQGPQHNGRVLFERLNLQNKNEKAVEIAYRTLGKICDAIGKTTIKDSAELHGKPFKIEVDIEKGKPYSKDGVEKEGRDQNRIKKYLPRTEAASSGPSPSADNTPPWKK